MKPVRCDRVLKYVKSGFFCAASIGRRAALLAATVALLRVQGVARLKWLYLLRAPRTNDHEIHGSYNLFYSHIRYFFLLVFAQEYLILDSHVLSKVGICVSVSLIYFIIFEGGIALCLLSWRGRRQSRGA